MSYASEQFAYVKSQGWLPHFEKAAHDYEFETSLLLAIASRESNCRNIVGDGGHGYSIMQIDNRSFPEFCSSGQWRNVALAIQKGAQVLDAKRTAIEHGVGDHLIIGGHPFVGARMKSAEDLLRCSVAAYNCGLWSYYNYSIGQDPDRFTTNRDYSRDVLDRQKKFSALLGEQQAQAVVDVKWVQSRLNALGVARPALIVDGIVGVKTKNAVAHFQEVKGLYVDGIVGKDTLAALRDD